MDVEALRRDVERRAQGCALKKASWRSGGEEKLGKGLSRSGRLKP